MSGDGADLNAPKEALDSISRGITASLDELGALGEAGAAGMGRNFCELTLSGMQLGHAGLTSAFGSFCERWEWGVRDLVQEGNDFAAKVGLSAGLLHQQDQYVQGGFKVLANSAVGDPHASADEITAKSWGELSTDTVRNQLPGPGGESWQNADAGVAQTWKNTAWEVSTATSSPLMTATNGAVDAAGWRGEVDAGMHEALGPSPEEQRQRSQSQGGR